MFLRTAFVFTVAAIAGVASNAFAAEPLKEIPEAVTTKSPVRIWVDQLGYRNFAVKIAIIAADNATMFDDLHVTLYDAKSLAPVWDSDEHPQSITPMFNKEKDRESGDYVAHINFSDCKTSGRYFFVLHVAPDRSYEFNIAPDVYTESAKAAWRMFYYQRCDTDLPEKFAGPWNHKLDHQGPHQATEAKVYKWNGHPWYEPVGSEMASDIPFDVTGGWWDAGDFDKYMGNTVICQNQLLFGQQLLHFQPGDNTLNIPESGNGQPDGLDQIKYCTDFLIRMADKTGAAFGKVYEHPTCPPDLDTDPVQLTEQTAGATLNRCAALAYAGVVWEQSKTDPAFAKRCLAESHQAWNLLQQRPYPWTPDPKNPKKEKYSGEWFLQDQNQCKVIAAACYFYETGDKQFDDIVHEDFPKGGFKAGDGVDWYPVIAVYSVAKGADAELVASMQKKVLDSADGVVKHTGEDRGYAAGLDGYWWGSNRGIGCNGLNCLYAAEITKDPAAREKYLNAAEEYVHYLHGRNPIGLCYITNMKAAGAEHSAMLMFHSWLGNPSKQNDPYGSKFIGEGDGKIGPPPGYIVGGANGGMKTYNSSLNNNPWTWNEPDITYQSSCVVLLSYFGYAPPAQPGN